MGYCTCGDGLTILSVILFILWGRKRRLKQQRAKQHHFKKKLYLKHPIHTHTLHTPYTYIHPIPMERHGIAGRNPFLRRGIISYSGLLKAIDVMIIRYPTNCKLFIDMQQN